MIRWFLFPLLIVSPAFGQGSAGLLTSGGGGGGGGAAAPDWTSYFVAVWPMEGTAGEANDGGSCGTNCNLTETGTVTEDTTNFVVGAASRSGWSTTNYLTCVNATCTGVARSTGDLSVFAWIRMAGVSTSRDILDTYNAGVDGWHLQFYNSAPDLFRFQYGDGAAQRNIAISPTGGIQTNTWYFVGVSHDDGTGQAAYIMTSSLSENNTAANTQTMAQNTTKDFFVSDDNQPGVSNVDEIGVYDGVLSQNAFYRICACNVDGSDCTVSGGAYTDEGRWTTACGGSVGTLPCATATSPASCS